MGMWSVLFLVIFIILLIGWINKNGTNRRKWDRFIFMLYQGVNDAFRSIKRFERIVHNSTNTIHRNSSNRSFWNGYNNYEIGHNDTPANAASTTSKMNTASATSSSAVNATSTMGTTTNNNIVKKSKFKKISDLFRTKKNTTPITQTPIPSAPILSDSELNGNDKNVDEDTILCIVCCERKIDTMLNPCHHTELCCVCAESLTECCTCRAHIEDRIKIFTPFN
jgi:hypothetical protein